MTLGRRLLRVLGLVLLGVALAMLAGLPFPAVINPALRMILLGMLAALGAAGLILAIVRPRHAWYHVGTSALLTATCIAALGSRVPSAAGSALLLSASLAGIGVLALEWTGGAGGRRVASVLVGVGLTALIAGTYLAACAAVWLEWLALGMPLATLPLRPAGVGGLVPGPIWTTDYIVLLAPIGLVLLWPHGRRGRAAAVVLGAVAAAAVIAAAVRAVWLAEAAIVLVLLVLWLRRRSFAPRHRAVAAAALGASALGGAVLLAGRLDGLLRSVDEGRLAALAAAGAIAARHPVAGAGPGTYGTLRMGERADSMSQLTLPDAHNLIAQVAAELGLLGLLALGTAAVVALWAARRTSGRVDGIAVAGAAGLAAVLAHRMVDMVFLIPGIAVVALIVGAMVLRPERSDSRYGPAIVRVTAAAALLALVLAIPASLTRANAEAAYREAVEALDRGHAQEAISSSTSAIEMAADLVPAYVVRSIARAATGAIAPALADAERALALEPSTQAQLRVAVLLGADGRPAEAAELYRSIVAASPADPAALLTSAAVLLELGDERAAGEAMDRLLRADPRAARILDQLPQSLRDIGRERARIVAAERLDAVDPQSAIQVAFWLDGHAVAAAALEPALADAPPGWSAVLAALDGGASTWSALEAAARERPSQLAVATWWVAGETCRIADRDRWARIVEIQTGKPPAIPVGAGPVAELQGDLQPDRYPDWIWGVPSARTPYTDGTWLLEHGQPEGCVGG